MNNIMITVDDYQRILSRMNFVPSVSKLSTMEAELYHILKKATTISPQNIPKRVITMNSRIRLREVTTQKEIEIVITYPENANHKELKVSIFSEIGIALIGRKVGDQVSWKIPYGIGYFEILSIPFQPEASGNYAL